MTEPLEGVDDSTSYLARLVWESAAWSGGTLMLMLMLMLMLIAKLMMVVTMNGRRSIQPVIKY